MFLPEGRYDGDFRFFNLIVNFCAVLAPTVILSTRFEMYTQAVAIFTPADVCYM